MHMELRELDADAPENVVGTECRAWERSLESLLGTGGGAAEPVGPTRIQTGAPLAMELSLIPGRGRPGDAPARLMGRLIQRGKAGGWTYGSLSWGKLDSNVNRGDYRPAHVLLLREMLALHRAGMNRSYRYSQADERFIELSGFESARLWPLLDEAYEAGLHLVHAGRRDPVGRHRDAELCLDITATRTRTTARTHATSPDRTTGTALTIAPVIRVEGDDERCVAVGFLGSQAHGVIYRHENETGSLIRLATLVRPAPASLQRLALDRGRLAVPAAGEDGFRSRYYARLSRMATLISCDGSFPLPQVADPAAVKIAVSVAERADGPDWFDLGVTITVEDRPVPFADVFRALNLGETHLMLADGTYFSLEIPELRKLKSLIDEARALRDHDGPLTISRFQAGLWDELAALGVIDHQARAWQRQVQGLLTLREALDSGDIQPPGTIEATLRPYQLDGFRWLAFLWRNQLGGILADDMGLGKTLQTLTLICHAKASDPEHTRPFLIVAPTSVVPNWAAEAAKFAPGLTVRTVTGRGQRLSQLASGADAIVTSYTLFRLDFEDYQDLDWSGLILDEAQSVKNHQSQTYQCARKLAAPVKVAITGTPMENNLMELWSLLSITAPGLFPNPARFKEYYVQPIEKKGDHDLLAQLKRRIKPVLLRRTKQQVAGDLPAKQEQVLEVELHPAHRKVYQTHLQRERQKVLGLIGDINANRFTILRSLTLLRQLSLHPALIDTVHGDIPSAKIDTLIEHIRDVADGGHRALVFSQFTSFLTHVRIRLARAGLDACYLDGSTRNRADVLRTFKDGTAPVFLISLKAGGFGLNLTEADYCFLLDPWWNPATEAQAVDRTHRIGQTRNVMVYRLIAKDTIEEKVLALQSRKADLFASVMDEGNTFGTHLTRQDIQALFS